jgi:hypothetical protein
MKKSKFLAALLTFAMLAMLVPATVFADPGDINVPTAVTVPVNGIMASATVTKTTGVVAGEEVTVTVTLSGTAAATGNLNVTLSSAATGYTSTTPVPVAATVTVANVIPFKFVMPTPQADVTDLTLALVFTAGATGGGTVTGDSDVTKVAVLVAVPSTLEFGVDPFEVGGKGQIAGSDYKFTNNTISPVKVAVEITAQLASGVTLVDDPDDLSPDDGDVTTKQLYFAAVGANSATDNAGNGLSYDADAADGIQFASGALAPFNAGDAKASIAFALEKGIGTGPAASGSGGVAAFTFYGVLNSYAAWAANDVRVTANYTLTPLRPATYTEYIGDKIGLNQIPTASSRIGFTDNAASSDGKALTVAFKQSDALAPITFGFNAGAGGTVTEIKTSSNVVWVKDTDYTVNTADKTITITTTRLNTYKTSSTGLKPLTITVAGGDGAGTYTLTLNVTAN